jgi:hypothetical protein
MATPMAKTAMQVADGWWHTAGAEKDLNTLAARIEEALLAAYAKAWDAAIEEAGVAVDALAEEWAAEMRNSKESPEWRREAEERWDAMVSAAADVRAKKGKPVLVQDKQDEVTVATKESVTAASAAGSRPPEALP